MLKVLGPSHPKGLKRIHVGCGQTRLPGWWNVDRIDNSSVDECIDVLKEWPFEDVDYIYSEHFIEHLQLQDFLRFLTQTGNSLANGGTIRMTTPNLKWVMATHFILDAGFDRTINYTIRTNMAFYGWNHRFLFTEEILELILTEIGFKRIVFNAYGESELEVLRNLESHRGNKIQAGHPSMLCVEATRGTAPIQITEKLVEVDLKRFFQNVRPESY